MNKNLSKKFIFISIFLVILGAVLVYGKNYLYNLNIICKKYDFLNHDIACSYRDVVDKKGFSDLREKIITFVEDSKSRSKTNMVSVWFRDLRYGPTFEINSRVDFIPASLLKLPLAMIYLEISEDNPNILKKVLKYSNSNPAVPTQMFVPTKSIKDGEMYSIEELIEYTIVYSDNNASQLLFDYLSINYPDRNLLADTLRDLGILGSGSDLYLSAVNTKEYGSIFRLLYNSSFLNKDNSEKLLSMLARAEFKEGLNGGVPKGVVVAHKFGERFLDNGEKQLHDCGVIYYPDNPYQLCVMTRGSDYEDLKNIIQEISKQVYNEFDSRRIE